MIDPPYAWFYHDPFHRIFLFSSMIVSLLSNGLLLFIIFTTPSSTIGSYRFLLAVFATCDILTNLAHAAMQPYLHMTSSGLYFFPRQVGNMIAGKYVDYVFCLMFIATYYQTFLILAYHYVYRLTTVTRGLTHSFTRHWTALQWTILAIIINIIYISGFMGICLTALSPSDETRAIVPPEIRELYGVDLQNPHSGFTCVAIRRPDPISGEIQVHAPTVLALILLMVLFGGTTIVIIYCIYRINSVIRSTNSNFTEKTRKMQTDLFHALLIQTAVPVLFSYFPLAIILLFPAVTGISLGAFGNVLFTITAIFPCVDAFFVLFFIGRFRDAVIRLFCQPFNTNRVTSTGLQSTERNTLETARRS